MSLSTTEALTAPATAHRLDEAKLQQYLQREVADFPKSSSLAVRQFSHGQSNPTYLLQAGNARYVLRKKPPGRVLASAHAVEHASVLGTPFYVMEHVQGRIFVDPTLPSLAPAERAAAYRSMAHTLAALHSVDPVRVGLGNYGRLSGYCSRQVWRWKQQYLAQVQGQPLPQMQSLIAWLETHIPESDGNASVTRISHGDYRIDNLIFHPNSTERVLAVLDWELSTLGHPLADLAYSAMAYHLPKGIDALPTLPSQLPPGIPSEREYVAMYCKARGIAVPDPTTLSFFMALSLFRAAAILAGVGARAQLGNASHKNAQQVGSLSVVASLAQSALDAISGAAAVPRGISSMASSSGTLSANAPAVFGTQGGTHGGPVLRNMSSLLPRRLRIMQQQLVAVVKQFMAEHIYPAEHILEAHSAGANKWNIHPLVEQLKQKAKAAGLWNLWLPAHMASGLAHLAEAGGAQLLGPGLTNLEYAYISEVLGRSVWASEVFNCSAPDTGNMEVLARYGSPQQQRRWLVPLLKGEARSCFAMTEPAVASSDATNIQSSIRREGDSYVINGRKWWASGAMDPRCKVAIFMGKTDTSAATHKQQSMILVPMDTPGVKIIRPLDVFGFDDAPHGHAEMLFENVRVPAGNILLGEGRGFEIAQGRLGPGRLHHCMRLVGMGERALELMAQRGLQRVAFKKRIAEHGAFRADLARCRMELDAARLMVLAAAHALDKDGNKAARGKIAAAKVFAPNVVLRVIDAAIQAHGAGGVSNDFPLARLWAGARTLRIADGPDDVHLVSIARLELARVSKL
ncbi:hypothetical protein WJX72_003022 [[Myrmecia] bisecta]|uniref:Acyl-CoA dehydrogenase family member 11 n=1 Tax=[Myrmecia] bisecta TaxID=41462 RepID=A0AAW1Q1R7_9CHLO